MHEKLTDFIYAVRSLTEVLRDRPDLIEKDEELKDALDEAETVLEKIAGEEEDEDLFE